jgi:hypothetical protein
MHTGMLVAVAFLVFAAVVSAIFVRSHVEPDMGVAGYSGGDAAGRAEGSEAPRGA